MGTTRRSLARFGNSKGGAQTLMDQLRRFSFKNTHAGTRAKTKACSACRANFTPPSQRHVTRNINSCFNPPPSRVSYDCILFARRAAHADSRDKSNALKKKKGKKENSPSTNTRNARNFATRHGLHRVSQSPLAFPSERAAPTVTDVDANAFRGGLPCAAAAALEMLIVPTRGSHSTSRVSKAPFLISRYSKRGLNTTTPVEDTPHPAPATPDWRTQL